MFQKLILSMALALIGATTVCNASQQITACGCLGYSESNRDARNTDDVTYSLAVDCKKDGNIRTPSGTAFISIEPRLLAPQQKGHITRWRRQAVGLGTVKDNQPYQTTSLEKVCTSTGRVEALDSREADGTLAPYICIQGEVSSNPCAAKKQTAKATASGLKLTSRSNAVKVNTNSN